MHVHSLIPALIALCTTAVSAPSCGDDANAVAPVFAADEQGNPRVTPPPPTGVAVTETYAADTVKYLISWPAVVDKDGAAQSYNVLVRRLVQRDTVLRVNVSVTNAGVAVLRPLAGSDTVRFEVSSVRRGLTSTPAITSAVITALDQAPPPPDSIVVDTVVVTPPPPPPATGDVAELPRVLIDSRYPGYTRSYRIGANLQVALDTAKRGDRLLLPMGAVYTGNYRLPAKAGTGWIIVESDAPLPAEGTRADTATSKGYAVIRAVSVAPAFQTVGAASSYYRLVGLRIEGDPAMKLNYMLVKIGTGAEFTEDSLPHHITLDRVVIYGHDALQLQRCATMNGNVIAVVDSWLGGCHYKGSDSQALIQWNSRGPFKIVNNFLEGAGENVMFGGSDPNIPGMVAADIEIRRNHFYKPRWWYVPGAMPFTVKNLFELKNARRVLIEDNVFENNWADGQAGRAIVFKSSNSSGRCDWCGSGDITFRWNHVKNSPIALHFHRFDLYSGGTAVPLYNVDASNNLHTGMSVFPNTQRFFILTTGVRSYRLDHNTSSEVGGTAAATMDGTPADTGKAIITNNLFAKGTYGWFGSGKGEGNVAIAYYEPLATWTGNAVIGGNLNLYPAGNTFPTSAAGAVSGVGVDQTELTRRLQGVRSAVP